MAKLKTTNVKGKMLVSDLGSTYDGANPGITLAIGDNDTGFKAASDGNTEYWSNNQAQYNMKNVYHTGKKPSLADLSAAHVNAATQSWNCEIQGQTWSRILALTGANTVGHSGILTIRGTRGNVVFNHTFMINTSHATKGTIIQLGASDYTQFQIRLVVDTNGNGYVEIFDSANSISATTKQGLNISFINLTGATLTKYTAFTSGATIPSGYAEQGKITTVAGSLVGKINGHTVSKSVPSNAVFTDTNTWRPVVNALNSTATDQSLSAAQGKWLNDNKANASHGNHVPGTQTANNAVFLRNDNNWATVTPGNIGAVPTSDVATTATANKIVRLDSAADVNCRLLRSNYQNQTTINGAIAYRTNNSSDNYLRFCSDTTAIRNWIGAAASNHPHGNATTSAHGFMSNTDKSKLDGIATGANKYTHPNDANTRHVTDGEKGNWNGAVTKANDWNSFKTNGGTIGGDILSKTGKFATESERIVLDIPNYNGIELTKSSAYSLDLSSVWGGSIGEKQPFYDIYLSGVNKNMNGYTKLPNGMIIMWGDVKIVSNSGYASTLITYPVAYPNTVFYLGANVTSIGGNPENNSRYAVGISAASNKQAFLSANHLINEQGSHQLTLCWFGVGY